MDRSEIAGAASGLLRPDRTCLRPPHPGSSISGSMIRLWAEERFLLAMGNGPVLGRSGGRRKRRAWSWRACFGFLAMLLGWVTACSCTSKGSSGQDLQRLERPMMGSLVEAVWRTKGKADEADCVRSALDRMESLASRMSLYSPESELVKINEASGKAPVRVSEEVLDVIEKSLAVSRMTGGAFDATIGSVEAAWGDIQRERGGKLPETGAVQDALDRVGYQYVETDAIEKTVFLAKEGMRLDLGGIAKGYIADQGMAWLNRQGIRDALINAGGDICVSGSPDGPFWRIGLQDPFREGHLLGVFLVRTGAVVTSGNYERYFKTEGGKRYTHILNPRTGQPVEGLVSVTVIAEESFFADAMATALMVKGLKDGMDLLRSFPAVRGVLVDEDGTIWVEEGLRDVLKFDPPPSRNTLRFFPSSTLSPFTPAGPGAFLSPLALRSDRS